MDRLCLTVIDVETTGFSPPAEVIEVGWQDVVIDDTGTRLGAGGSRLLGVVGAIPPETMAVHHITPEWLEGKPLFGALDLEELLHTEGGAAANAGAPPDVLVAHNWSFEGQWFTPDLIGQTPTLCTLKAACRAWPQAPGHANSVLRYWLGLRLDEELAMPPHRAGPDAYATAHILCRLLADAPLETMLAWSQEPRIQPRITFGKHKGEWANAPADYLAWIMRSDMDADTKWNAQREINRRKTGIAA